MFGKKFWGSDHLTWIWGALFSPKMAQNGPKMAFWGHMTPQKWFSPPGVSNKFEPKYVRKMFVKRKPLDGEIPK